MRRHDETAEAQREGRADAVAGRPAKYTGGPPFSWAWRYAIGYDLGLAWLRQVSGS